MAGLPDNRLREPLAGLLDRVADDWRGVVQAWRDSTAGRQLVQRVEARRQAGATIYPAEPLRALALTPSAAVRVVILGQDPYHGPGQAEGLAFSVPDGVRAPPSLRNIVQELERDLGAPARRHTSLETWARQGVLLLNTVLTVEDGRPASHTGFGWEALTDEIVASLCVIDRPIGFLLWGAHAAAKADALARVAGRLAHRAWRANHPSPLSARRGERPFIGCGHFGAVSRWLATVDPDRPAIDWRA